MTRFRCFSSTAALLISFALPANAGGLDRSSSLQASPAMSNFLPAAETRKGVKSQGGKLGGKITTTGVVELSSQDCKNVGGTVITVGDDRCGASRKYCRMPDTNAVCIDVLQ